jgi:putative RNA 2'-phosphotransferase
MKKRTDEQLSKEISYTLRHNPKAYNLTLDESGWVAMEDLLSALNQKKNKQPVTEQDIVEMLKNSEKKRFEIMEGRIRAYYGHSVPEKIELQPAQPPKVLYHGTTRRVVDAIKKEGLKPRGRQYVHLSQETETALLVGKRRDDWPVLIIVDAERAWQDGIRFYHGNEMVWLSDEIPAQYLTFRGA